MGQSDLATSGIRGTRGSLTQACSPEGGARVHHPHGGRPRPDRARGLPNLVTTRGSLYCLLPGIGGLRGSRRSPIPQWETHEHHDDRTAITARAFLAQAGTSTVLQASARWGRMDFPDGEDNVPTLSQLAWAGWYMLVGERSDRSRRRGDGAARDRGRTRDMRLTDRCRS